MFIVGNLVEKYTASIENTPWLKNISSTKKVKPIAHAENRSRLEKAIKQCEKLGETADKKSMYLYRYTGRSPILREIGRLREVAFRAVGEGTNKRRDIDQHDKFYFHLILWDNDDKEIVGAYRFGDAKQLSESHRNRLYSATLFHYHDTMKPYIDEGLELGRSFVQPKYWGKRSLDYLWFGIGAFLKKYPRYRYLFGPVSLSNDIPDVGKDLIVHFYQHYFSHQESLAKAIVPYENALDEQSIFSGKDYKEGFSELKQRLSTMNTSVPTLYKQYTETYNTGGVHFLSFSIDAEFNDCVDGLVLADLQQLKEKKRLRYMS
jgi:putative hemolysin